MYHGDRLQFLGVYIFKIILYATLAVLLSDLIWSNFSKPHGRYWVAKQLVESLCEL
jgi:hypothetical protein